MNKRTLTALLIMAVLACLFLWLAVIKAVAHDWYPIECCHSIDCAPVENWSYVGGAIFDAQERKVISPLPRLVVTTSRGTFVIPDNLPRRESKDNRMHVCNRPDGSIICIFVPPAM